MKKTIKKASLYPFEKYLEESLKDPEYKKEWDAFEPEFQLASQMIEARIKRKMSQRALAQKVKTSQAAISRLEAMNGNPSLSFLKRVATALDTQLKISLPEYVTPEQEARYLKDIKEAKALMKQGKITPASSVEELRQQIEKETTD